MVEREERKREADRRNNRDSYSSRHRSRWEREPSPKKFRRDRERDEKRTRNLDHADSSDRDLKRGNRSREAERSRDVKGAETKRPIDDLKDSSERKFDGDSDANKLHSDPKEFARSKICIQHDERGSAGQVVQIHIRHDADKTRSDLKEHKSGEKLNDKTEMEARHTTMKKDDSRWGHDGFSQLDSDPASAKEMPSEPELHLKSSTKERRPSDSARNDEMKPDMRSRSRWDEKVGGRDGGFGRGTGNGNGIRRTDYRDRFRGRGVPRGQERFTGARFRFRDGNRLQQSVAQTEKWKHDKYEEANQSTLTEEDQIAKVEALLKS